MGLAELDAAHRGRPAERDPRATSSPTGSSPQRWFGSKSRDVRRVQRARRRRRSTPGPPLLALMLLEARLHAGTHELYQLPIVTRAAPATRPRRA